MTGLPSWAVPGRKVVCIDATNPKNYDEPLTKNRVYAIRSVLPDTDSLGQRGVTLVETIAMRGYATWRFRPVITLEEDMLTFRSLLNTVPASRELAE